jgi:L-ribulokinase
LAIVVGVDFGTLSVRASVISTELGQLSTSVVPLKLTRSREDPGLATQSHSSHVAALASGIRRAVALAGVEMSKIAAIAVDTTGSSVVPVDAQMNPLDDYYMWCDHRARDEARLITRVALESDLEAIAWCGGVYSHEWGFAKLLHWLRHNPEKRRRFASAFEHCDFITAWLTGAKRPEEATRSVCAMGHKWLWNPKWGGYPSDDFFESVDPLLRGVTAALAGAVRPSDHVAGVLCNEAAATLGLPQGIPVPVGAFDAHWDAIGAGCKLGDVVNVIGTSTCIIGMSTETRLIPGICGTVPGSVHPGYIGIEAGLSATGNVFEAIAGRAKSTVVELSETGQRYKAGETGLLRFPWDNGDRTVLVNPDVGGITLGWHLQHTPEDELFAAIEGCAFHTRIVIERLEENGVLVNRLINAGGIPRQNSTLNQVYANTIGKPVLVPNGQTTSLGAGIFAALVCGAFATLEEAQARLCAPFETFLPETSQGAVYEEMFAAYRQLYFEFGDKSRGRYAQIFEMLNRIARSAKAAR